MKLDTGKDVCFLATTALEEFWGSTKPMVFLGEWCLPYGYKRKQQLSEYKIIENCWNNKEKLEEADCYVRMLYDKILVRLSVRMNIVHKRSYSGRFWRILIGPWLFIYISAIYDRYAMVSKAAAEFPLFTTIALDERDFLVAKDTDEFEKYLVSDQYNLQIYSRIFTALGKKFPKRRIINSPFLRAKMAICYKTLFRRYLKNGIVRIYNSIIKFFCRSNVIIISMPCIPRKACYYLTLLSRMRFFLFEERENQLPFKELDLQVRGQFNGFSTGENEFEKVIFGLIPFDIPKCFVENFVDIEDLAFNQYPKTAAAIFSSVAWFSAEVFKYWAAFQAEQGVKLIGMQHGGDYGIFVQPISTEFQELSFLDFHYTWGWMRSNYYAKTIPFSVCKLVVQKEMGAANDKYGILFIVTSPSRYIGSFDVRHQVTRVLRYFDWQKKFYENLDICCQEAVRIRFRPDDTGWRMIERVKEFAPDISMEIGKWRIGKRSGAFLQGLGRTRLFVCDHLSTTYIEALSLNKPTILFWDEESYCLNAEAQPFFNRLKEVGILYHDPVAAAHAVNKVYADVEGWWNSCELQRARNDFCAHYARAQVGLCEWYNELKKYLN